MAEAAEKAVVRKSIRVQIPPERAFAVFVENMENWWPAEHHIGQKPFQAIFVEPRTGGRWFERDAEGTECEWGYVLQWDPPKSVKLSWHLGPSWKFDPDLANASEVEIRFTGEGPQTTFVELEHSALERHGEGYEQLRAMLDGPEAWEKTLSVYGAEANRRASAGEGK
jgi:hypothetical protein